MLDLFAGAGGLTQGFHQARSGYRTVRAVEMDLAAAASYAHTFGEVVYPGTIQDWLAHEDVPEVDVVVGGPPCQGFSTLGKQDAEDERNTLWREYVETVAKAQPKFFVLENVPAFLKSPQFALFREATEKGGKLAEYEFSAHVLNAADYGAAQVRKRVVVIGYARDLSDPGRPEPTHVGRHITVGEALKGVATSVTDTELPESWTEFAGRLFPGAFKTPELHLTRNYQSISRQRFAAIPRGGNRFDLPPRLMAPCWRKHLNGSADVMGRLLWHKPSVTIRTEFHKPEKGRYLHPDEDRALTHYEAALLQGFPPDHQWVGSKVAIARQIGNAVPVPLGRAIARHLAAPLRAA
ncbi:DNA (cytosine-5-)-methyltransferase [Amycolatopsis sp. KNN50.9b]|nr:DNA (cytosine-5-)-methyltransferase [Amycolatopsis sp. KNN50.9b]